MSPRTVKLRHNVMLRLDDDDMAALEADARRFGHTVAQSARVAVKFYLAATPPPAPTKNGAQK